MNIVQAIHLEEQRSNACLQRIEAYQQQKRDYLSKVEIDRISRRYSSCSSFDRSKNANVNSYESSI